MNAIHIINFFLQEAEESIRFYKNIQETDEHQMDTFKQEFDRIKSAMIDDESDMNHMSTLHFADFKTKYARKSLVIGMILILMNACYSIEDIGLESLWPFRRIPLREEWSRLIVAIVAVLGANIGMQLVDRVGRRVSET